MKNFLNKYKNQIIIIVTILFIVLISTRFTNLFGSNTDWLNQHTVFPEYFRQTFYKTGKILPNLSLNYGAGENIYSFSYYGLLSPLILPSYLLPFMSMTTYMTIIDIIVVIGSALLFYAFLKNHKFSDSICLTTTMIFILSGPIIFQMHRHIMFVNYMPFLIMCLMGVDNYIQKNKKSLLIISIFLMIMTSYYYSVGGLLVIGIYYIYSYLEKHKKFILKEFIIDLLKFIGYALIAILMSSIILLPTAYTLLIGRGESTTNYTLLSLLTPYLNIHKIFCGAYAIGLSVTGFIALMYMFYTKKKSNVVVASLVSLVLFIPIFRYLLNGGIYLREKCFIPFIPLISYFIAILLRDLFNHKIKINNFLIYLTLIFAIFFCFNRSYCFLIFVGFALILLIYKKINKQSIVNYFLVIIALLICIVENLSEDYVTIDRYNKIFNSNASSTIKDIISKDSSFYRMNNLDYPTETINVVYDKNYFTTNIYSSTYNNYYLDFVRKEFLNSMIDYNYFLFSGNKNILFNSFMGVKYLYSSKDLGLGYTKIDDNLYQNNLVLPIIYGTNNTIDIETYKKYSYPYNIELFLHSSVVDKSDNNINPITNIEEVSLDYELMENNSVLIENNENGYILKVNEESGNLKLKLNNPLHNKLLFIDLEGLEENTCRIDNIEMTINDVSNVLTCKTWIYSNKNNTFHFLINDETIDTFNITLKKGTYKISNITTNILDYDSLLNIKDNIVEANIDLFNNDNINGTINMEEDGYLITSIPYDEGFKLYIDDVETKIEKVNLSFLGAKLSKGDHKIKITYNSPWLKPAKIVSIISIIAFILIAIYEHKKIVKE